MSEMALTAPLLSQTLHRAALRVRGLLALRHGATGLLAGALLAAIPLLLLRANVLAEDAFPAELLVLPPILGLVAGVLWGYTRRISPLDVARLTEQRLDLKERFSTAIALLPDARDPLALRQIADAEAHAGTSLDLRAALPLRAPRRAGVALVAVLALAFAWFLPNLSIFQSPRERAERAAVEQEGERIVRIAKVLEQQAAAKRLDQTRRAANQIATLGREMKRGRMNQQKALMKFAKLTEQMKQSQQALAAAQAPKSLPAAGRELKKALQSAQAMPRNSPGAKPGLNAEGDGKKADAKSSPAQQAMQAAEKALGNADMPSLAEQLSKLAQQAQQGQPGDKNNQQKLAGQLGELAKALKRTSLEKAAPDLQKAAEAMKNGDLGQSAKNLQEAARKIAETAKKNEDAQSLQKMAEALGQGQGGEATEGASLADAGEGQGDKDAFGKNGKPRDGKGQGVGNGSNPGNGNGTPGGTPRRFGAGPQAGKGRLNFRVTQGGPQKGTRRQDPNFKPGRDDKFARLYAPKGKTPNTRLTGRRGEKGKETISFFRGAPEQAAASVPYYDVYGSYAPAAEKALNREDIPMTYKKQVKDYFDSLNPGGGR